MLEASVSGRSGWNFLLASYCETVVNMVYFSLHLFYCTATFYPPQRPLADYFNSLLSLHNKVQEKEATDPVVGSHRSKKNPNTEKYLLNHFSYINKTVSMTYKQHCG